MQSEAIDLVCGDIGCGRATLFRGRTRFQKDGVAGLLDHHQTGGPDRAAGGALVAQANANGLSAVDLTFAIDQLASTMGFDVVPTGTDSNSINFVARPTAD